MNFDYPEEQFITSIKMRYVLNPEIWWINTDHSSKFESQLVKWAYEKKYITDYRKDPWNQKFVCHTFTEQIKELFGVVLPKQIDTTEEAEFKGTLARAYKRDKHDCMLVDGRSGKYLADCTNWALKQGYIQYDENLSILHSDSQWTVKAYTFTDKMKELL